MSFQDYDNFITTVARWMARDDLENDIADAVWMTECELQRTIRFDLTEEIATGTTIPDQDYVTLPEDLVEPIFFRWDNADRPALTITGFYQFDNLNRQREVASTIDNRARVGAIFARRLYMAPAQGNFGYRLYYKAGIKHLGTEVHSNRLLTEYPDALLYGTLTQMAPFVGADERIPVWREFYMNAREEARKQEWRKKTGGGPLAMVPDVAVY